MSLKNLANLVTTKQLKPELRDLNEFNGLLHSGKCRLQDSQSKNLSIESRFDLAYNAAHAFSLASLRMHNYRPSNRYIVFQTLQHTLEVGPEIWMVLSQAHHIRNLAEYEGYVDVSEKLLDDLISVTHIIAKLVEANSETIFESCTE